MKMAAVTRSSNASPSLVYSPLLDSENFPLKSINDVVNFFKRSLKLSSQNGIEPDLTLLSIIVGYIEISLTTGDAAQAAAAAVVAAENNTANSVGTNTLGGIAGSGLQATGNTSSDVIMGNTVPFPVITYELVAGLYKKFQAILSVIEKPKTTNRQATRETIKKVSDVIWHSLIRSTYKDRAHLQNLYSYLSGNKLDCFGVAFAVVAGCQLLGYRDVHLAISEDHAWVVFGGNRKVETIEVTWHGKGAEDKRGQDIQSGIDSDSWLYLKGMAVVCDRAMEVAAIVAAINISLTANSDCVEVAELQQKLLWLIYDLGHLKKYPMAIGTLGELEEINPTHEKITCEQLYREAIQSARQYFRNHHVYPYTYQGNYYNRLVKYREAFASWANAADVIRLYTYNCRDDEEIYKELLDIANEMIPYVMKTESSGHSARSILRDSEVFANLLRFYDGICQWEEDSGTPILHIGWAKPLVNNITKFDYDIRSQVFIKTPEDGETAATLALSIEKEAIEKDQLSKQQKNEQNNEANNKTKQSNNNINLLDENIINNNNNNNNSNNNNNNNSLKKDEKLFDNHNNNNNTNNVNNNKKSDLPTTLADLTAACGEKILNPEFLLQGGNQPFAEQKQNNINQQQQQQQENIKISLNNNNDEANLNKKLDNMDNNSQNLHQHHDNNNSIKQITNKITTTITTPTTTTSATTTKNTNLLTVSTTITSAATSAVTTTINKAKTEPTSTTMTTIEPAVTVSAASSMTTAQTAAEEEDPFEFMLKKPVITLYSQKMKGLKDLLLAEKLNTHAILLQVTAQSVASKKIRGVDKTSSLHSYNLNSNNSHSNQSSYYNSNSNQSHYNNNNDSSTNNQHHSHNNSDSIAVSRPKRARRE